MYITKCFVICSYRNLLTFFICKRGECCKIECCEFCRFSEFLVNIFHIKLLFHETCLLCGMTFSPACGRPTRFQNAVLLCEICRKDMRRKMKTRFKNPYLNSLLSRFSQSISPGRRMWLNLFSHNFEIILWGPQSGRLNVVKYFLKKNSSIIEAFVLFFKVIVGPIGY